MLVVVSTLAGGVFGCKSSPNAAAVGGQGCVRNADCPGDLHCINSTCASIKAVAQSPDEFCRSAAGCREKGLCSPGPGGCVAASDADCAQSKRCKDDGACGARSGKCTATETGCRQAPACQEKGECTPRDGSCYATTDEECAESEVCITEGRCFVGRDPQRGDYRRCMSIPCNDKSKECTVEGQCGLGNGSCFSRSDEDCRNSERCRTEGRCSDRGNVCGAVKPEDCQASDVCREQGLCAVRPGNGTCMAVSAADCRKSENCAALGQCSLYVTVCAVTSDADCQGSRVCREQQFCTFKSGSLGVPASCISNRL